MDEFTFQPASGTRASTPTPASSAPSITQRARPPARDHHDLPHPADAATPAVAGFKVITLFPGEHGYPRSMPQGGAFRRTAGYVHLPGGYRPVQPETAWFVDLVHRPTASPPTTGQWQRPARHHPRRRRRLHVPVQPAQDLLGPARFDRPGCAAVGVKKQLAKFLPNPVIAFDGKTYRLDCCPDAIDKIRAYLSNVPTVLKAYAWVMAWAPPVSRPWPKPSSTTTTCWRASPRSAAPPSLACQSAPPPVRCAG